MFGRRVALCKVGRLSRRRPFLLLPEHPWPRRRRAASGAARDSPPRTPRGISPLERRCSVMQGAVQQRTAELPITPHTTARSRTPRTKGASPERALTAFVGGPITSIAVALLVAGLVRLLVFVFLEVPLLAVVPVVRMVVFAFAHTLRVCLVLRIILLLFLVLFLVVVLEKWSAHSLYHASTDTNTGRYRQDSYAMF